MKKNILFTLLVGIVGMSCSYSQYIVKPTFFETQDVSNEGVVSGYEAQAGPYSLWNPEGNTFIQIGGAAPGQGIGGAARFSDDGMLISGTTIEEITSATEWEKLNTGYNYIFKDFEFPEGQDYIAYAGGQSVTYNGDGIVIKTYDGGETWEQMWFEEDKGIEAISFPTVYTGYVGGWNQHFAKTTDGGFSWTSLTPGTDVYIYTGIVFKDEFNGVVTAQTNTDVAVYITNDGGATWTTGSGLTAVPYKLTHVSGDTYFLVNNNGDIQKSDDNGLTWTTVFSSGGLMLGIEFYDASTGIATGEDVVYITTDGGVTWTISQDLEGVLWRDVAWLDQNRVTLVGTPEMIFASEDGGNTWPIDNLGTTTFNEALYEVTFTNNGTGYILGSQGVMFRKASETAFYSVKSLYNVANDEWAILGSFDFPIDNNLSSGYNISGDGTTVVGSAYVEPIPGNPGVAVHATAWTSATGLIDLGSLYTQLNRSTRANAVNEDGSVIVGWQDYNGPWKSAVWRMDANGDYLPNEYLLIDPNGDPNDEYNQLGEATAVSADGNWIAGKGDFANNNEPWMWSESTGYVSLGSLAPGSPGYVTGMNNDASILIGFFQIDPFTPNIPFIWTAANGMVNLNDFITETLGFTMGNSPIYVPNGISSNGKYITGWGYDPTIGPWGDLFTFRLELPSTPTNNTCETAISLECGDLVTNATVFATNSGGNGSPDVYYTYTGTGSPEMITLNACGTATNFPTTVRIFSDCSLTNQIAFNDSSCENQPEFSFESNGTATYYIMVEGYSSNDAGTFQLEISCESILGTESELVAQTVLFPNPVQDILTISSKLNIDSVTIYTITGARLFSESINNTSGEVDFSNVSSGVYFVEVIANDVAGTFKIIKD